MLGYCHAFYAQQCCAVYAHVLVTVMLFMSMCWLVLCWICPFTGTGASLILASQVGLHSGSHVSLDEILGVARYYLREASLYTNKWSSSCLRFSASHFHQRLHVRDVSNSITAFGLVSVGAPSFKRPHYCILGGVC